MPHDLYHPLIMNLGTPSARLDYIFQDLILSRYPKAQETAVPEFSLIREAVTQDGPAYVRDYPPLPALWATRYEQGTYTVYTAHASNEKPSTSPCWCVTSVSFLGTLELLSAKGPERHDLSDDPFATAVKTVAQQMLTTGAFSTAELEAHYATAEKCPWDVAKDLIFGLKDSVAKGSTDTNAGSRTTGVSVTTRESRSPAVLR
jgi:hypothetical protein